MSEGQIMLLVGAGIMFLLGVVSLVLSFRKKTSEIAAEEGIGNGFLAILLAIFIGGVTIFWI